MGSFSIESITRPLTQSSFRSRHHSLQLNNRYLKGVLMKSALLVVTMLFTSSVFAAGTVLKCDLYEDDKFLRTASDVIDSEGEAWVGLGEQDIYSFSGFVWDGHPVTLITSHSPDDEEKGESETDTVISSTGSTLTLTCAVE